MGIIFDEKALLAAAIEILSKQDRSRTGETNMIKAQELSAVEEAM